MIRSGSASEIEPRGGAKNGLVADRLLLDIIDTVREPLLVLDAEFRVMRTNRAFFRTFRVAPSETLGKVLFDLGEGQWDIPPLRALLSGRLNAERELYDVDVDHEFPSIGRKIMLLNARLVSDDPDVPRVILLAIEDVTDRRLAERRLAAQQHELERSNAALNEFAFVASHDLQEPLRKIVSFGERLETAAGHSLTGNARIYLDRMLNAAGHMRALIGALLSYSQIASAGTPFAPTDLVAVMRGVLEDLEVSVTGCGGRIDVGTLPTIDADASQIRQLFQNLLANALKFRRPDVPPIVTVDDASEHSGECVITVTDNGIGFKQEHGEKIFRMFERLNARTAYEGSGIGLAICRKIVERHGGTIEAASAVCQGTTFTVVLPITHIDADHVSS